MTSEILNNLYIVKRHSVFDNLPRIVPFIGVKRRVLTLILVNPLQEDTVKDDKTHITTPSLYSIVKVKLFQ